MKIIGTVNNGFCDKFGVPRQSGMTNELSTITFFPPYNSAAAFKGIQEYSHLWILWQFSLNNGNEKLSVRPPKLGGNTFMGVFATRSPFRPNSIGLSCVELVSVDFLDNGVTLTVRGLDAVNGTPVIDIKPYLPYTDAHFNAKGGFGEENSQKRINVVFENDSEKVLLNDQKQLLEELLSLDPRPGYHKSEREYKMDFHGHCVTFTFFGGEIHVKSIT